MHFFPDLHALVSAAGPPLSPGILFVSSLGASARFVFLNASMGDQAAVTPGDAVALSKPWAGAPTTSPFGVTRN
jgi:hypothetical protein